MLEKNKYESTMLKIALFILIIQLINAKPYPKLDEFISESVTVHNAFRNLHSASPLILNVNISKIAQSHADFLVRNGTLRQSYNKFNDTQLGENILSISGKEWFSGEEATKYWYDGSKKYDYKNGTFSRDTGSFTQLVWRDTRLIGFGVSVSNDGTIYIVANYFPPGNVVGKFTENVIETNRKKY